MIFSSLLVATLVASTDAFIASSQSRHATKLNSYLDSLNGAPALSFGTSSPSSYGDVLTDGGINDICAFDAASSSIKTQIASYGAISADDIHARIAKANEVVCIIREHFPGALGSSEILRRVTGVLDGWEWIVTIFY